MASSDTRFTHESLQDAKTIKTLLTALSKGFSKGEMTLSDGDRDFVLPTGELMTVRIRAERQDGQCEFRLNVSWKDTVAPAGKKTPTISS